MKNESKQKLGSLTPYHHERNEAAMKAVKEMLKHPLTLDQIKEQVKRLNNQSWKNRFGEDDKKHLED